MRPSSPQPPTQELVQGFHEFFESVCTPIEQKIIRLHAGMGGGRLDASSKRKWLAELLTNYGISCNRDVDRAVMAMTQAIRDRHPSETTRERSRWFSNDAHATGLERIVEFRLDATLPDAIALRKIVTSLLDSPISAQKSVTTKSDSRKSNRQKREAVAPTKPDEFAARLLQKVDYPLEVSSALEMVELSRGGARKPGPGSKGITRTFESAKNGTDFLTESDQEWSAASWLEECHQVLRYSSQPIEIFYSDALGKSRRHFPDFFVQLRDGRGFLLELKPFEHMFFRSTLHKTVAARNYSHSVGLGYCQCGIEKNRVLHFLTDLTEVQVPDSASSHFLELMDAGGFTTSSAVVRFRQAHGLRNRHLYSMILTENLDYENNRENDKFWLRRATDSLSLRGLV